MKRFFVLLSALYCLLLSLPSAGQWAFVMNSNDIYNTNSGNIGIGTTTPAHKLHIASSGNINLDGGFVLFGYNGRSRYYNDANSAYYEIYSPSNTDNPSLAIRNSSDEVMRFDGSSNVGIGTTSPTSKLHVAGTFRLANGSEGNGKVLVSDANGTASWQTLSGGSSQWTTSGNDIYSNNSGNVGIGTTTPSQKLHISGGGNLQLDAGYIMLRSNGRSRYYNNANSNYSEIYNPSANGSTELAFWGGPGEMMRFDPNGNMGIGITTPASKLHVAGNLRLSKDGTNYTANSITLENGVNGVNGAINIGNGGLDISTTTNHPLSFYSNSSAVGVWFPNGNLRIGTTNPYFNDNGNRLQVEGNAWVAGNMALGNTNPLATATPNTINLGGTYSGTAGANLKLRLWDDGIVNHSYGLGVSSAQLEYVAPESASHVFFNNGGEKMRINPSGFVGIGVTNPSVRLDVAGSMKLVDGTQGAGKVLTSDANGLASWVTPSGGGGGSSLWTDAGSGNIYNTTLTGKVAIGTTSFPTSGDYKLAVKGSIIAEKVRVKLQSSGWPDYVFHEQYPLPGLKEVEQFINTNNHLPGVPSAASIEKNGLDLGDGQAMLLKKIEELTLYIIEINKTVDKLVTENELMKKKLEKNR